MKRTTSAADKQHLQKVAALGCILCDWLGTPGTPAQIHHVRVRHGWGRSSHQAVIGLCDFHHNDQKAGVHGQGREEFTAMYGVSELALLDIVHIRVGA
jgi:hypothetical protein